MQSSEQVVQHIIDLDERAEQIRARAREDSDAARRDTQRRIAEGKAELENRIAARAAEIEEEATRVRDREIARVRKEYSDRAESVRSTAPEKMEHVLDLVVARIKGRAGWYRADGEYCGACSVRRP